MSHRTPRALQRAWHDPSSPGHFPSPAHVRFCGQHDSERVAGEALQDGATVFSTDMEEMPDPLLDVLAALNVRVTHLSGVEATGHWGLRFDAHEHIKIGAVLTGSCVLGADGEPALRLSAGDCFLMSGYRWFQVADEHATPLDDGQRIFQAAGTRIVRLGAPGTDADAAATDPGRGGPGPDRRAGDDRAARRDAVPAGRPGTRRGAGRGDAVRLAGCAGRCPDRRLAGAHAPAAGAGGFMRL